MKADWEFISIAAIIIAFIIIFDGDPSIAESLRVMAAKAAGIKP